nr:PEP-CTERM sorting domain-containing protein [Ferrimicrobium acidiphilum]
MRAVLRYLHLREVVFSAFMALFSAALLAVPAAAGPVAAAVDVQSYLLNNVTFSDGGAATGTFTADFANNTILSADITTSTVGSFPGETYNTLTTSPSILDVLPLICSGAVCGLVLDLNDSQVAGQLPISSLLLCPCGGGPLSTTTPNLLPVNNEDAMEGYSTVVGPFTSSGNQVRYVASGSLNATSASTAADVWVGASGSWNNSSTNAINWTTGTIPTSLQAVTIGAGSGGTVSYNDANDTVGTLVVKPGENSATYTLSIGAGDALTATNGISVNNGGNIDVEGDYSVLVGPTITNGGTVEVADGGAATIVPADFSGSTSVTALTNTGALTIDNSGSSFVLNASSLPAHSDVAIGNSGIINLVGQGSVLNDGLILKDNGNQDVFTLSDNGSVVLSNGLIEGALPSFGGANGTEILDNQNNNISGPGTILDVAVQNFGTISQSSGVLNLLPNSALGAVSASGLTVNVEGGGVVNSGEIAVDGIGSEVLINTDYASQTHSPSVGGLYFPLSNQGTGTITVSNGGTVQINSNGAGGVALQNDGTINLLQGGVLAFNSGGSNGSVPFSILPSLKVNLTEPVINSLQDLTSGDVSTLGDVADLAASGLIDVLEGSTLGDGNVSFQGGKIEGVTGNESLIIAPQETFEGALSTQNISIDNLGNIVVGLASVLPTAARIVSNAANIFNNLGIITVDARANFLLDGGANSFGNFNPTTGVLEDGTYNVAGTWQVDALGSGGFTTNAASITMNGSGQILNANGTSALATLQFNAGNGSLQSVGGANIVAGDFSNAGTVIVGKDSGFTSGGAGNYLQTSGGTEVDGTLTAPGGMSIDGGTLSGSGTIVGNLENAALVSPSPADTLTVDGNFTQDSNGTLQIDISNATDFSGLDITGFANLGGSVTFDFLDGYLPGENTNFNFLNASSLTGGFGSLHLTGIDCVTCSLSLGFNDSRYSLSLDTGKMPPSYSTSAPEPSSLSLVMVGLAGLALCDWRRRRRSRALLR